MRIGLVGSSYQQRSLPFDAQRTVNLVPLADKEGADVKSLLGSPGLELFGTAGVGPVRKMVKTTNGRVFALSGVELYEISSAGIATLRGTVNNATGSVSFADNGTQLGICDGDDGYILTYSTNAFAQITDPDFPTSITGIDFVDGYFFVGQKNTGKFFISALYNGSSWGALDFATAESSPDNLMRAVNFVGYIGLFGDQTLEIWRNTGDSSFPFSRISGLTPVGTVAPGTIISIDTSVYWVGNTSQGTGIVYQAQGFTPTRISTEPIERILQAEPNPELLTSWTYQQDGHTYLVITGGSLSTSLCYDLSTKLWHERAFLNTFGNYEPHLAVDCIFAFNKYLVGDRRNGNIYTMSPTVYTDNGSPIKRQRIYTHLLDELKPVRYSALTLGVEQGVGLQNGTGSNPILSLRVSRDGARTWGDYHNIEIGAVGKYQTEVTFRRLGIQQQCTFEITYSEPTKFAITGSYLK